MREYVEAWKFLGRGGDEDEVKKFFDTVDLDGSGLIEWTEFAFSLMGEKAANYGALADLETLALLMDEVAGLFSSMEGSIKEMNVSIEDRKDRNAGLRNRLQGVQADMQKNVGSMFSKMVRQFCLRL